MAREICFDRHRLNWSNFEWVVVVAVVVVVVVTFGLWLEFGVFEEVFRWKNIARIDSKWRDRRS